ncbi:hypothetical protein B0H14DRAFT_2843183 [Mycena olivaceomarginata]|nr:hypothetical protein B0H14DRAFT_2843183 [Mycena olivaceomarginata]
MRHGLDSVGRVFARSDVDARGCGRGCGQHSWRACRCELELRCRCGAGFALIEYESRGASCPQPRRYLRRRVDLQCSVTNTYLNPMLFIAGIHYVVPPFRARGVENYTPFTVEVQLPVFSAAASLRSRCHSHSPRSDRHSHSSHLNYPSPPPLFSPRSHPARSLAPRPDVVVNESGGGQRTKKADDGTGHVTNMLN